MLSILTTRPLASTHPCRDMMGEQQAAYWYPAAAYHGMDTAQQYVWDDPGAPLASNTIGPQPYGPPGEPYPESQPFEENTFGPPETLVTHSEFLPTPVLPAFPSLRSYLIATGSSPDWDSPPTLSVTFAPSRVELYKKDTVSTSSVKQEKDRARRQWLVQRLSLSPNAQDKAMLHTSNNKDISIAARLPLAGKGVDPTAVLLSADFSHAADDSEAYLMPVAAEFLQIIRPPVSGANCRIQVTETPLLAGFCRIYVLAILDQGSQTWTCSSRYAVYGVRQMRRPGPNSGSTTPPFDPCDSDAIVQADGCPGDVFCGNSRHLDRMIADRPDLRARLPFEQQYCLMCSSRDPRQQLTPPYELLGRERSWSLEWGRRIARCFAEMHKRSNVKEPMRGLGYGTHRYAEREIDWRRKEAIEAIQAGLCLPITADNSNAFMAHMLRRAYQNRELLVVLPGSVHTNSLWNVETADSVIIRRGESGEDRIELLNPRMDNCRRSDPLDPMQNIARYVYLEWATNRFKDDPEGRQWQAMIEGPWLLESYFDDMEFSAPARRLATQRFWLWLDLEVMLYIYLATPLIAEYKTWLVNLLATLKKLDRITSQKYPVKTFVDSWTTLLSA